MKITPSKSGFDHHFLLSDVLSSETGEPYYSSVTPNGFLGHSHPNPCGSPSSGKKRGDTKGETIFDIPGMALRPQEEGWTYSMCVCLCKWLLCSSDNATAPAGARGYGGGGGGGGGGSWDWLICCTILSDTESPFTVIIYRYLEGGDT